MAFLKEHAEKVSREQFLKDPVLKRAFVRCWEIIGEATKNLDDSLRRDHPEVDWRGMAGMRDRLIHGYFSVDYELVWDAVQRKIPGTMETINRLRESMK